MTDPKELLRHHWPLLLGAAPIAACLLGRGLAPGFSPSQSHAAESTAASALVALDPLPAEVQRAMKDAAAAIDSPIGASPFVRHVAPAPVGSPPTLAPDAPPTSTPSQWSVSSIMADRRSGGALAVINGKVRRTGEQAAPGWTVERIDAAGGTVTLRGPGGISATVTSGKRQ